MKTIFILFEKHDSVSNRVQGDKIVTSPPNLLFSCIPHLSQHSFWNSGGIARSQLTNKQVELLIAKETSWSGCPRLRVELLHCFPPENTQVFTHSSPVQELHQWQQVTRFYYNTRKKERKNATKSTIKNCNTVNVSVFKPIKGKAPKKTMRFTNFSDAIQIWKSRSGSQT